MDKPLIILNGTIRTPPFSTGARRWAGFLLRALQKGHPITMPDSRPMPGIGTRCHELRVRDAQSRVTWRIVYRLDPHAIVIADIFPKKTQKTQPEIIDVCQKRFRQYDQDRRHP